MKLFKLLMFNILCCFCISVNAQDTKQEIITKGKVAGWLTLSGITAAYAIRVIRQEYRSYREYIKLQPMQTPAENKEVQQLLFEGLAHSLFLYVVSMYGMYKTYQCIKPKADEVSITN